MTAGEWIEVPTEVVSADGCPAVAIGSEIWVVFDGQVLEPFPARLVTVFAIYEAKHSYSALLIITEQKKKRKPHAGD